MIKVILEENNIKIKSLVTSDEFELLKKIGITVEDDLISTLRKINRHLCNKYCINALFMIDKKQISDKDKRLLKIYKVIEQRKTNITF